MTHIKRIDEMNGEFQSTETPASIEFFVDNPRFDTNDEYLKHFLDDVKEAESLGDRGMFINQPFALIKINDGNELRDMTDTLVSIINDVSNAELYKRIVFILRNADDTIFTAGDVLNRILPLQEKHHYYPSHLFGIKDHSLYTELCKYAKTIDEYRK